MAWVEMCDHNLTASRMDSLVSGLTTKHRTMRVNSDMHGDGRTVKTLLKEGIFVVRGESE
jgi:hypothetical protein